jgi:hypothetical protein
VNAEVPQRYHVGSVYEAQGIGRNYCTPAASYQEINTTLQYYGTNSAWDFAAYAFNKGVGGETITAKATFTCVEGILRAWRTQALGYSVVGGVGYTATQYKYNNLYCYP